MPSTEKQLQKPNFKDTGVEDLLLKCTVKQRLYVEARVAGLNKSASLRAAGAAEKATSREYENHPRVKAILQAVNREAMNKLTVTRKEVLEGLMDSVNAAATSTEMTMAWREIGKLVGAYEPEVVRHETTPNAERLRRMTDRELLELTRDDDFELAPSPMDEVLEAEYEVMEEFLGRKGDTDA